MANLVLLLKSLEIDILKFVLEEFVICLAKLNIGFINIYTYMSID